MMAEYLLGRQKANKKKAFQNMLKMREQSMYPKDFDYKKIMEEAVNEKYCM